MSIFDIFKKRAAPDGKHCTRCHSEIYDEEKTLLMQHSAVSMGNFATAMAIEQKSGYRCKTCRKTYCKDCLEKYAPGNSLGGKSCPSCGGLFEVMHNTDAA